MPPEPSGLMLRPMTQGEWLEVALASIWASNPHDHVSVAFVQQLLLEIYRIDGLPQDDLG